jgi:hypothetical protein
MTEFKPVLEESIKRVEKWVEDHGYKGYEPFDGLSSFLRPLTFGNLFLERILMQLVRQSPVNLRPIFGIKPLDSTIGRGYMAWGYLKMLKVSGDEKYRIKAEKCLQWLIENKSPGYEEFSWGKHFDFAGRGGGYPKFEPITVWTCLIGMAFLEAYEILKKEKYLEVADSISRWVLKLARNETERGICFSYTASGDASCTIHNHSMLAAAMLARTSQYGSNKDEYLRVARGAMNYSCSCQLPNGGWYYGEEPMHHWIDNFHTGYNLDSLKYYIEGSGDRTYEENLKKGFKFYVNHFFEGSGRTRYYHNRTYPVDSQCASQSIDTLAYFSDIDPSAMSLSSKVASWVIENMQGKEGYFYYREYPGRIRAKTPMLHWAQATTYKALTHLLSKINAIA